EPAQAPLDLPPHPRGREPAVARVALDRVEDLGGEDEPLPHVRALPRAPLADPGLAAAAAVGVRRVEGRDPGLPGGVHQRERLLAGLALPEEGGRRADSAEVAAAEDQARHADAAATELARFHAG